VICSGLGWIAVAQNALAYPMGIYLTQATAQNTLKLNNLIHHSKANGISIFVIDYNRPSARYQKNVAKVRRHGIRYVARIVVYPRGGTHSQVISQRHREKKWRQIRQAMAYGAQDIQLDYIRYKPSRAASVRNEQHIYEVIRYFRDKMQGSGVKLQVDIFGEVSHRPSRHIGQNARLFAQSVDALCPMVYPSHYEPYRKHAVRPYETVYNSVSALRHQIRQYSNVKVYAYIELYNYRYPMSYQKKMQYIKAQIRGAKAAGADGIYVWNPWNRYQILFNVLQSM